MATEPLTQAAAEAVDWSTQPQAGWATFRALREVAIAAMTHRAGDAADEDA